MSVGTKKNHRRMGELSYAYCRFGILAAESTLRRRNLRLREKQTANHWNCARSTSSAPLLTKQGKRDEARAMLAEIYNWFTEGFDTADLKDAKALLDELSG